LEPDLSAHAVTSFDAFFVIVEESLASYQAKVVMALGVHRFELELLELTEGLELEEAPLELTELEGLLSFPN
jgi:hypothetical protein